MKMNSISQVQHNRRVHDSVLATYDHIHTEIFNPTEQARIASVLEEAISQINTQSKIPLVLDFGAGTGNLTRHLLNLGVRVLAADVSLKSLASLKSAFGRTGRIDTVELNGVDLSNLEDNSVDMVATYSVLHHIQDYLAVVKEFLRVVKSGGVIYIDHENAPSVWLKNHDGYTAYRKELQSVYRQHPIERVVLKLRNLFSYDAWRRLVNRKFYGLGSEGDIHVFIDDHIEWNRIEDLLLPQCILLNREDYLVCRELNPSPPVYEKYKARYVDMRVMICQKK